MSAVAEPLLDVRGVSKVYRGPGRGASVRALDRVDLELAPGSCLAVIGESGSGKSTLARLLTGVERPTSGVIRVAGSDIGSLRGAERRRWRRRCQMMFQDSLEALDPRQTAAGAIFEALSASGGRATPAEVVSRLEAVGLAATHGERRPHQLSGGQRQRVALARVLAAGPDLVVLDEPVSGLDASLRRQILDHLDARRRGGAGSTQVIISHDLTVARRADRVAVMYLGTIVEEGPAAEVLDRPRHPYTEGLLASRPRLDGRRDFLDAMVGEIPSASEPPPGCAFHPRCPRAAARCIAMAPSLEGVGESRSVACFYPGNETPPAFLDRKSGGG
ncbi:MAG: ABC transporter ATP-binding protein [Acidobacteriota bacterium]